MPTFEHLKALPFTIEKAEAVDEGGRKRLRIDGWASTETPDRSKEVIEVGFFDESLADFMRTAAMPWMHDTSDPQGKWAAITPVPGKGYHVTGDVIDLGTDLDTRRMAMVEEGLVASLSVGFNAEYTDEFGYMDDATQVWHWTQNGKLIEVSLCTIPCNPDTSFQVAKMLGMVLPVFDPDETKGATPFANLPLADEETGWDARQARKHLSAAADTEDGTDWGQYAKGFLWFDRAIKGTAAAYYLPFADVIDGELKAVWRGCAAAMSALRRGSVDIPEADQERCLKHLAKYYKLFGKPLPEKSADSITWHAGEEAIVEEDRFVEDLERMAGGAEAVKNIHAHWQSEGRTIDAAHRERIAEVQATLVAVLEPHPAPVEGAAPQGAPSLSSDAADVLPALGERTIPEVAEATMPGG